MTVFAVKPPTSPASVCTADERSSDTGSNRSAAEQKQHGPADPSDEVGQLQIDHSIEMLTDRCQDRMSRQNKQKKTPPGHCINDHLFHERHLFSPLLYRNNNRRKTSFHRSFLFLCMQRLFFAGCFEAAARFATAAVQDQAPHPNRKKSCRSLQQRAGTLFSHLCFSFTVYIQSSGGKRHDDSDQQRKRLHPITPLSVYILSCFL